MIFAGRKLANAASLCELRLGAVAYDAIRQSYLPRPAPIIDMQDEFSFAGRMVDRLSQTAPVTKHLFDLESMLTND